MIGKRVYPNEQGVLSLGAGDFGRLGNSGDWFIHQPGQAIVTVPEHRVLEHRGGEITIEGLIKNGEWL